MEWTNEHDAAYAAVDWRYVAWAAFSELGEAAVAAAVEAGAPLGADPEDGGFRLEGTSPDALDRALSRLQIENETGYSLEERAAKFRDLALKEAEAELKKLRRAKAERRGVKFVPVWPA